MLWALYQKTWYFVRGFARLGITSQTLIQDIAEAYMTWSHETFHREISVAYPNPSGEMENQALRDAGLTVHRPRVMDITARIKVVQQALKEGHLKSVPAGRIL